MRTPIPTLCTAFGLALLIAACGGGGDDPGAETGARSSGGPELEDQQVIEAILNGCARSGTDELLALFESLAPFVSGSRLPPGFTVTGFDLRGGTISWSFDVENDGVVDVRGTSGFRTSADAPYIPAGFLTLVPPLGDPANLPTVLAGLPDGTILRSTFNMTRGFATTGSADIVFANATGRDAVPSMTHGTLTMAQPDCEVVYTWTDVAIPDLNAGTPPLPTATVDVRITAPEGVLLGSATFDGTTTATLDLMLDGTATARSYLLDLETGALTPVA